MRWLSRHLGRKGSPGAELWPAVSCLLKNISKEGGMNCALQVPSPPLSFHSQYPQTGCLRQLKSGEVTRPFPHVPRGELKVLKQLRFFDSSVYSDSMTQHLDISLDLWYQLEQTHQTFFCYWNVDALPATSDLMPLNTVLQTSAASSKP